ncbi:MAG TPA: hypothetical protein VFL85_02165 [Candidatus Saccharimonadales bacterium]|nr:hypothetical protein [Candidatus Saccharimonadales bacterium]
MPTRKRAKAEATPPEKPFDYPKLDRDILDEVRRQSHDHPWEFSQHAETLIDTLPADLREALWHDFGEAAIKLTGRERKETNMNMARMIVAFSLQHAAEARPKE